LRLCAFALNSKAFSTPWLPSNWRLIYDEVMTTIASDLQSTLLSSQVGPAWKNVGVKIHHGINIPLFALHTKNSAGIGEFLDLKPVIDWCKKIGYDIIQILPINDNGPEPSPYSAISAFALNPLHISLSNLPGVHDYEDLEMMLAELKALTKKQRIDYKILHKKRNEFLHLYYQYTYAAESQKKDYIRFEQEHDWLQSYALFKTIKNIRDWQPWEEWPQALNDPCPNDLERLKKEYKTQILYHIFLQYFCFKQLEEVKKYAQSKGVLLKGDIPILISRESADVWHDHNLFILTETAGAPPDMFSKEGQNWQFPIYNWQEMEKQHFVWWQKRLELASRIYDLFRIDHVVGFFRLWAIPFGKKGNDGKFIPEDSSSWIGLGTKNLSAMLLNCPMLPIGEDLGVVPPEVRVCLKKLGICGTKVMRWERYWNGDKSFINIKDYIPESMTTVSTHDSETLRQWWRNHPDEAKVYAFSKGWNYAPEITQEQFLQILKDSHHSRSLFHINLLNEYLSLVPNMTWPILEDERINDPAVQSDKNWTYRFRPSFEEIAQSTDLENLMKNIRA
jgi:4-alpha-glucanotransferase